MKGHIHKRGRGWAVVISLGKKPDGSGYQQKTYTAYGSKDDAEQFLRDKLTELHGTGYLPTTKKTVAQFAEEWLANYVRPNLRPSTIHNYEYRLGLVLPHIGPLRLDNVTPLVLMAAYRKLGEKYSGSLVNSCHGMLHRVFAHAVKWRYLTRNPADDADAPPAGRSLRYWTPEQAGAFLARAKGQLLYAAYYLAIATGLRRGELLALRWQDVDLEQGRITVRNTLTYPPLVLQPRTKTDRGRAVPISALTAEVLREHRTRCTERRWARGLKASEWVFASPSMNQPVHPAYFSTRFGELCRKAGVPRIRPHDLRHCFASLLLAQGIHPKVVSEMLGHSSVNITLNTYSHLLPGIAEQAATSLDRILSRPLAALQIPPNGKPSSS